MKIQFSNIEDALRRGAPTAEEQRIIDEVVKNNGIDAKRCIDKLLAEHPERIVAIRSFLRSFPSLWWDHRHLDVDVHRSKEVPGPLRAPSNRNSSLTSHESRTNEKNGLFQKKNQEDWDSDTTPLLESDERDQALESVESRKIGNTTKLGKRTRF